MDLGLNGKQAVVTGASKGLGRAIAVSLAREGAHVLAVARNAERLQQLHSEAAQANLKLATHIADLKVAASVDALGGALGKADVLVLNSGGPPAGPVAEVPDSVWSEQFDSMFLSMIRLTRLALPGMRERRFGRIIVVVSSGVIQPIPNLGISNAIRSAVIGWAKTLAAEVAPQGITVNCLAPGRIATDRVAELDQGRATKEGIDRGQVEREARAAIPMGRYGQPDVFSSLATFLAGSGSAYMTGGVLRVDGGMIRAI